MSDLVQRILEEIENGEITVEDGDRRVPTHPLDHLLQYVLAPEQTYGF